MSQQSSKSEKAADKPKSSSEKEKDKEKKKSSKEEKEKKKPSKEEKENEKKPVKEDKKKDEKKKDEKKKDAKKEDAKERPHCISSIHVNLPVKKVEVHPLVLLSVVDHFGRATRSGRTGRAVGVLLGSLKRDRTLDVANCFAVPFDEEGKDTFFLDRDYLESMSNMFRKVAARERIVGWYHTGPRLRPNDIAVNEQLKAFTPNPVLVIVAAAEQRERGLPTEAYIEDGTPPVKSFEHVPSSIAAEASEDIGVEQLLSQTAGTLSQRVTDQLFGVRGLETQLRGVEKYLRDVAAGALPVNHTVIFYIQASQRRRENLAGRDQPVARRAQPRPHRGSHCRRQRRGMSPGRFLQISQAMCVFLGSLVRSVIALHNLLDNKIALQTCDDGDGTELNGKKKKKKQKDRSHLKTSKTVSSVSK